MNEFVSRKIINTFINKLVVKELYVENHFLEANINLHENEQEMVAFFSKMTGNFKIFLTYNFKGNLIFLKPFYIFISYGFIVIRLGITKFISCWDFLWNFNEVTGNLFIVGLKLVF